ncbi:MAG: tRNA dimethylallyltransferase [Burkholderiaceae bacterium]|jgi:tRNA dimethylallyltransferase|nr:MAG: tRNA dimethylallyltransferase [Burkholderiaceae bacterium]
MSLRHANDGHCDGAAVRTPEPRWIALAGPTAAGKTAAALAIAHELPVEIVSVDSALVYRGMDIGTAKPSAAERTAVPHHLIDIRDPCQPYSAAEFAFDARRLIAEINARGRLPLLVGGTMLYFNALLRGIDEMPAADAAVRAALQAEAQRLGWPAMHEMLARVDPATAARLAPHDAQRIARALEVHRVSGRPLSVYHTIKTGADREELEPGVAIVSLEPRDRGWLHARIARRFDAMLEQGFLDEVRALRARGDLNADLPAMRCVGYRQAWAWLAANETMPHGAAPTTAELRDRAVFATRQLAKRQLTWLRAMHERQVVACDDPDAIAQVLALVRRATDDANEAAASSAREGSQ